MYARISRFEGINVTPELAQEVEEKVTPILESLEGWQGGMQLLDSSAGNVLTINLFDTEEHMRAAEQTFEEMPQRLEGLRERLGGARTSVERYQVVSERRR
jgi:hypothetical protein